MSRAVARLIAQTESRHAGTDILRGLVRLPELTEDGARRMLEAVEQNRLAEDWERRDLGAP